LYYKQICDQHLSPRTIAFLFQTDRTIAGCEDDGSITNLLGQVLLIT